MAQRSFIRRCLLPVYIMLATVAFVLISAAIVVVSCLVAVVRSIRFVVDRGSRILGLS
jgi:uncharacterized BrkB/YihY/UPF0761 family membrane protein